MSEMILELEGLSIGFSKSNFDNINTKTQLGSLTALMGVNGVGKSCLLKTISNLLEKKGGTIKVNGVNINEYSPIEFAKTVAIVLTEKIQADFLRVDELVALGRSPYTNWLGELTDYDKEIVAKSMNQVGISDLGPSYFSALSDGQKQKVMIARALSQTPKLLVLDEPTTYLDIPSKVELIKLLKKISKENNIAVILSTHDLNLIQSEADIVWLMGMDGRFTSKSPAEFISTGEFKKHFNI